MSYKRKRIYGPVASMGPLARKPKYRQATPYKRRKFIAGADRVGGYYGRYTPGLGELKFFDTEIDTAQVQNDGTSIHPSLNLIPQNVTESGRVGRKCTLKSIHWRYSLTLPEVDADATAGAPDNVRMIMYLDKQANGAAATAALILETAGVGSDIHAFRNLANSGRFRILCDKNINLNYGGLASDNAGVVSQAMVLRTGEIHKKVDLPLEFNGTTGVIAEVRSNNVGILFIGVNNIAGVFSTVRVRFSDK